jgi:hypothetical protein
MTMGAKKDAASRMQLYHALLDAIASHRAGDLLLAAGMDCQ